jgi:histidinol phosphatase-like PHP family hydrolase
MNPSIHCCEQYSRNSFIGAVSNCKVIELNARYHRPPLKWLLRFKEHDVRFHFESDAHSLEEIVNLTRLYDLIAIVDDNHMMQEITAGSVIA